MNDTSTSAVVGLATVIVNVVVSVIVGSWALRRKVRDEAALAGEQSASKELNRVQRNYERRVEQLEQRLERVASEKDAEIKDLREQLGAARVTIAEQAAEIRELQQDLAQLHKERSS